MDNITLPLKGAIQRSHSYPSLTVLDSAELVKKIYTQLGASSYQNRDTIAKVLNLSPDSLNKKLSTSVQYDHLDLKSKEGYKPTPLFIKLYKPLSETEKKEALLQSLKNPKLYSALLEEYNNNIVPSVVGLSTNLYRNHNISESASERAAQVFIQNLKDLGLLDEENHLTLGETLVNDEKQDENKAAITSVNHTLLPAQKFYGGASPNIKSQEGISAIAYQEELPLVISLKDGKKARLFYPEGITNDDWDKVIRIIQAMKE